MKKLLPSRLSKIGRRLYAVSIAMGFNPLVFVRSFCAIPGYFWDYFKFMRQSDRQFDKVVLFPCLADRFESGGEARGHYFHQDLLVARRIYESQPLRHVDIGSRVDGFVAHVAAFREIEVLDIRPTEAKIKNIIFRQADFMEPLPVELHGYADSVSCLHALEHFGLGRYGDPVRADGHLVGINNIHTLCRAGGRAFISVPIGSHRIEFNGHRVFSPHYLLDLLGKKFEIIDFSYVDDSGVLHESVGAGAVDNIACEYGCGIFELRKSA